MNQLLTSSKRLQARASRRGSLLLISVFFVLIVASMGMVMLQMHTAQSRRQLQATDNKRALYIAEAGLSEAFFCLAQGRSGNVGSEEQPAQYANGVYWVQATPAEDDSVSLVSTGLCGTGRFALSLVLNRQVDQLGSLGFYAAGNLTVGQGAVIDGYDSSLGALSEQRDLQLAGDTTGSGARLSAGGDVSLEGTFGAPKKGSDPGTQIFGDVQPGPNGVVSQSADVTITGSTRPLAQQVSLPAVDPPENIELRDWQFGPQGGALPPGEARFEAAEIASGGVLHLEGPAVLVFDDLRFKDGARLRVDSSDGQVVVFVEEYLELAQGSWLENLDEDPTGFVLFANGTEWLDRDGDQIPDPPVVFDAEGQFFGYLYAPGSDIVLRSELHMIGGLAASSLTLEAGGHLTFDRALEHSEVTSASLPELVAWRIVELPDNDLVKIRRDPLRTLSNDGITPTPSAVASKDTHVKVKYFDAQGEVRDFSGLSSDFDWSEAQSVVGVIWDDDASIGDEGQEWFAPATLKKARVKKKPSKSSQGKAKKNGKHKDANEEGHGRKRRRRRRGHGGHDDNGRGHKD